MSSRRLERVAESLRQEVAQILLTLADPRIHFVSVTKAEVSPDLGVAKIFVTILGTPGQAKAAMVALERAAGHIRAEVGRRLSLRSIPALVFRTDRGFENALRVEQLLNDLAREKEPPPAGTDE